MNQTRKARMIVHGITAAVAAMVFYFLVEDSTVMDIAIFVVGYIALSFGLDHLRDRKKAKQNGAATTINDTQIINNIFKAVGGSDNVELADHEANRIKITLKDVDLLSPEMLNELSDGGAGSTLAGNQLQIIVGTNSGEVARQITEVIGS